MSEDAGSLPARPGYAHGEVVQVLLSAAALDQRVEDLAEEISADYAQEPPLVLGVLTGGWVFLADLVRRLEIPCRVDFVALGSYGNGTVSSGEVTLRMAPRESLAGQAVLVVEDIVDTGRTLAWLLTWLREQGARVRVCCLLDKPSRREVPVELDYVGFTIPDHFVVGYGLDCGQQYRALPYVAVLRPPAGGTDADG